MKNRRQAKPELRDVLEQPIASGAATSLNDKVNDRVHRWVAPLRTVAGFALIVAISVSVAWGARRYLMTSPRFALERVEMTGQRTRTKDDLLARANVKMGQNVFSVDLDAARVKMLGDPYVKAATLSRRLPDTVTVEIEERVPAAIVVIGVDAYLVTREGETFKRIDAGDPSDLPVITMGSTAQSTGQSTAQDLAENDREGFSLYVRRALDVELDYRQSSLSQRFPLQEIHIDPGLAVSLTVGSGTTSTLVLGQPPWRRKLDQAARVIAELERRGQKPDTILLDQGARPERVVARVR
jgi:cell division protein FtsQ